MTGVLTCSTRLWAARFLPLALFGLLPAVTHCSSASNGGSDGSGSGGSGAGTGGRATGNLDISDTGAQSGGAASLHPLCGSGKCLPDAPDACADVETGQGGATSMGGDAGFGGGLEPGSLDDSTFACRIVLDDDASCGDDCQVKRTCESTGTAKVDGPCLSSSDCEPGLACVGAGMNGTCRPYCCEGTSSCGDGYYCASREEVGTDLSIPVCAPVDNCSLLEPYPCPLGQECTCTGETACVVVRANGSTACAVPGDGGRGEACTGTSTGECAYGFVCSPRQGCLEVCSTVGANSGCEGGAHCQTPPGFPVDLGVCVGSTDSNAAR